MADDGEQFKYAIVKHIQKEISQKISQNKSRTLGWFLPDR
jgi:hypothetical protein